MRVLDVGYGSGDVALIARDLFGEAVGIDREEALLERRDPPVGRKEPPRPGIEAYQQAHSILARIADIPPGAFSSESLPGLGSNG
jgi:hypothetical protein